MNREEVITEIMMQLRFLKPAFINAKGVFNRLQLFPTQLEIIALIHTNPGIKQSEIAKELQITQSAVTQAICPLEKLNLIKRNINLEDRREHNLFLTELSKSLVKKFLSKHKENLVNLFECLTDSEIMELKRIQQKLVNNIKNKKNNE